MKPASRAPGATSEALATPQPPSLSGSVVCNHAASDVGVPTMASQVVRHDMPHRAPPQRACPGALSSGAKYPLIPGAVRATSRGRTSRGVPPTSVWAEPGLVSTSVHVASDPRPAKSGGLVGTVSGATGRGGKGGRASGPRATRVRRTSSDVGQNRHMRRWDQTASSPSDEGRGRRHHVHCNTGHPLSHCQHSKVWPSGPWVAGSSRCRRPVASS